MTTKTLSSATGRLAAHHIVALAFTGPLILLLTIDWVITGITGHRTFITDDAIAGPPGASLAIGIAGGLAFAALAFVLVREAPLFAGLGRTARVCRRLMIIGTVMLAIGQLVIYDVVHELQLTGTALAISDGAALVAIALTFIPALILGLTQVRHNRLGLGGRLLILTIPALLLTAAVALLDPNWASPVLLTISVFGGLSLLGAWARSGEPA